MSRMMLHHPVLDANTLTIEAFAFQLLHAGFAIISAFYLHDKIPIVRRYPYRGRPDLSFRNVSDGIGYWIGSEGVWSA